MQSKRLLFGLFTVGFLFVGWWLWKSVLNVGKSVDSSSQRATATATPAASNALAKGAPVAYNKAEVASSILASDSRQPITFYGKLVDQHGTPVPGVKVKGSVEIVKQWMNQQWEEHFTTTDRDGRFQFSGLHGQTLGISPEKEGYEYKRNHVRFHYSILTPQKERHQPKPDAPVVFTLWKLAGADPLITSDFHPRIPYDGTPVEFDIMKQRRVVSGGDIRISLVRDPLKITQGQKNYDWRVTIEMTNGGLLETTDQYMNLAPEAGYVPLWKFAMNHSSPDWQPDVERSFYVHLVNRKCYARVLIGIYADSVRDTTGISIKAWINPSGSRSLEYDPKERVQAR